MISSRAINVEKNAAYPKAMAELKVVRVIATQAASLEGRLHMSASLSSPPYLTTQL